MPNHASIQLIGHIGRDPEMKFLSSGDPVLRFSLAVNTGYGERKTCSWWECSFFGKRAEKVAQFMAKGKAIMVTGEPQIREWEKDGRKGKSAEVRVNEIVLLGNKDDRAAADDQPRDTAAEQDYCFTPTPIVPDDNVSF